MMRVRRWFLALTLVAMAAGGCGRKAETPESDDPERENELRLFREGVRTVQERYVDADRVQMDSIISNSIKGMVAEIDPYATILFTRDIPADPVIPDDVPLVEIEPAENPDLVILLIHGFHPQTRKQLRTLEATARTINPAGILVDARGASGSDYHSALDIASWLLPRNTVIGSIVEKQGGETRPLATRRAPVWPASRVVVLIDRMTTGPGEWLAAALQFHHRALLAGEPTRGITVIQSPVPITDEWTAMLTTGRVLNPDGRDITGSPLKPDILLEADTEEKENVDWLYLKGLESLKKIAGDTAAAAP